MTKKQLEAILRSLHASGDELYTLHKVAKTKEEKIAHMVAMSVVTVAAKAVTAAIEVTK